MTGPFGEAFSMTSDASKKAKRFFSKFEKLKVGRGPKAERLRILDDQTKEDDNDVPLEIEREAEKLIFIGDQLEEHGGDIPNTDDPEIERVPDEQGGDIPNTDAPEIEKEAERLMPFTGDQPVEDDAQRLRTCVYSIAKVILPTLKWIFILMIVTVELFQAVAPQVQEEGDGRIKSGSHYRKLAAILSSVCVAQSLMGMVYEAKRNGVLWKR